jgi:phage shock protein B
MSDNLCAVLIVTIVILGPVWIVFHYGSKARNGRALNANDSALLDQMAGTAQRLEQRVATLERILDSEIPAWRSNFEAGGQYGKVG